MKLEMRTFPLKVLKYCGFLNSFSSLEELFSSSGQASLSCFRSCYVILRPMLRLPYWGLGSLFFSLRLGQYSDSLFRQNTYLQNKKHMLTCLRWEWLL